ncbi:tripartite-type tricarboxylate transporter receptor subunit TctC [Chromohalobacter marismortui]|uniref:Tripartite-type tricarboxylate transporter receptor subunit TctC n=1 Tax=Chromohalobacter marismortui TaxID=42055 RepID=A0A4R7NMA9_9GAMM|nr:MULTISPECIES: tripartite tricarboxylate transporter substrate binding protein [Chromohalobacter]MCI0509722.1 tripartite tricarboxylate transporter substrate binding protein [Chromohalobacter sp.]MCI0593315.1 tripartite tricarboxylate transporter substrate binding protein [Chromohalobacter sp.]TDU21944.1 tripartite-type tricarboxylate transporter receptor subunit TctC [Chromohalobacter marismortui]
MIKKVLATLALSVGTLAVASSAFADYPERNIQGIIQWGAGGATDNVARSLTPHVEEALGTSIILNNRPGGTGVIGMNSVMQQPANGYTVLYGAENPQLYPIMGLADFDYSAMTPINVIGQGLVVIAAPADSQFDNFKELLNYAHKNPGKLRMGGTGAGGLPSTVLAMVNSVDSLDVRNVTFGGDGPGITAMLGNHIDFMPLSLAAAQDQIPAGRLKGLAVFSKEKIEELPNTPPITQALPRIESYLPWGPFWAVAVREGTPDAIVKTLSKAYEKGVANEQFQTFLTENGAKPLNLQGEKAEEFLNRWQSVTAWALQKADAAKISPQDVGIPKP